MKQNKKATPAPHQAGRVTRNHEGERAFTMDKYMELYTRVLSSLFGEPKYYENATQSDSKLIELVREVAKSDPEFVAGLAIVARNNFYLRTVPQALIAELAVAHKGDDVVSKAMAKTIRRADDMTELLAYYGNTYGKSPKPLAKLPKQLKLGLANVFPRFDAYQLAKYDRDGAVKLRDVLFLSHASPQSKSQALTWKKLIDGTLESPDTWEVALSAAGQAGKSKKYAWESILAKAEDGKGMGYMAILRNLRNFVEEKVDPAMYIPILTNPGRVARSKQFPYRFFSAYRELEAVNAPSKVLDAVIDAMEISVDNIPILPGRTLICADNSGSMDSPVSEKSKVTCRDIANLLTSIVHRKYPDAVASVFSDNWSIVSMSTRNPILTNMKRLCDYITPSSTNTWKIFTSLAMTREKFDRVVIFSDMQSWNSNSYSLYSRFATPTVQSEYNKWCSVIGTKPYVYSVDLHGYGTSDIDPTLPQVHKLAGWSDKVFNYIYAMEKEPDAIMSDIYMAINDARAVVADEPDISEME